MTTDAAENGDHHQARRGPPLRHCLARLCSPLPPCCARSGQGYNKVYKNGIIVSDSRWICNLLRSRFLRFLCAAVLQILGGPGGQEFLHSERIHHLLRVRNSQALAASLTVHFAQLGVSDGESARSQRLLRAAVREILGHHSGILHHYCALACLRLVGNSDSD